ncbi:MAG: hypothetical protein R2771_02345 [Saprospiraceae bacterium]
MIKTTITPRLKTTFPQLQAEWGNKITHLKWNTLPYEKTYFGYLIEESTDGINFKLVDSIPYYDNMAKYAKLTDTTSFIKTEIILEKNDKLYFYRLKGFDYFGEISKRYSEVKGKGFKELATSPELIFADQTEDNKAYLKWRISKDQINLIRDFSILRSETESGEYNIEKDSISKYTREIKIPIKHNLNYYRIIANPINGKSLSSMPVFVMGQDNNPPAKPNLINAEIDSIGNVKIKWKANNEEDLWGYRIYRTNFKEDEYILLNENPTKDTIYQDSIDIKLGNKEIYYYINACDKRNNMSLNSDTVELELPDIIPPSMPLILKLEQNEDTVKVFFTKSLSDDVEIYQIFKRELSLQDTNWYRLVKFDTTYKEKYIIDLEVKPKHSYAYTIQAKDKHGLESKIEYYEDILIKEKEIKFEPFKSIDFEVDSINNKISLKWKCNSPETLNSILIYKGKTRSELSKFKTIPGTTNNIDDIFEKGDKVVYYKLKPMYNDKREIYFSEVIEVKKKNKKIY